MPTYIFIAGVEAQENLDDAEAFFYEADDIWEATEMFLDEATREEQECYRVFEGLGGNLRGHELRHPQRPELGY